MPYLMRRLVVDELRLRDTFRIIRKYIACFEEGEISTPNFSHYTEGGEHAIRLRVDYRDNNVVDRAREILDQLVDADDIIEYRPDDWENKDNVSILDRNYCVLAFKCTSDISNLTEFEHVSERNPVDWRFPICFFHALFTQININLNFTQQDITNNCPNQIESMVNNAIQAVSEVEFNRESFRNPFFFKRFCHMFCNNLLVQLDMIDGNGRILQYGGENKFWEIFLLRNGHRYLLDECLQGFCENF